MRLVRTLNSEREDAPATSVAVGNFDGLHRGHQALIDAARAGAGKGAGKLVPALMCFEPLPATFFKPDQPQPRLQNLRDRIRMPRHYGIERLFLLRFDAQFARQSPERFVRDVLVRGARARRVVVGADFRFGSRASGDVAMLKKLSQRYGFEVECVDAVEAGDERVSSSRVRTALGQGDFDQAERLLGRPYRISGRVLRGRALGRELGYPTANIRPPNPPALRGITAARVHGAGFDGHPAVASLGRRPVLGGTDWLLEVHLFDYDGNLYGKHLDIEFVAHLRDEAPFDNLEAMTEQMHRDAEQARAALKPET